MSGYKIPYGAFGLHQLRLAVSNAMGDVEDTGDAPRRVYIHPDSLDLYGLQVVLDSTRCAPIGSPYDRRPVVIVEGERGLAIAFQTSSEEHWARVWDEHRAKSWFRRWLG